MTIFLTLRCNHHKNLDKSHQHNKSRIFTRERGKLSSRNCWLSFEIQERLKVAWWKVLTFCFSSGVATLVLGLSGLDLSYMLSFDPIWPTLADNICQNPSRDYRSTRCGLRPLLRILRAECSFLLPPTPCHLNIVNTENTAGDEVRTIYIDYSNIILLDTKLKTLNLLIFCQCIMPLSHSTFT